MKIKILVLVALLAAFATCASADSVWNVNATFSYNTASNTATGTFQLDPSLNLLTWNIVVAGSNGLADNTYNPGDSIAIFRDSTHLDFYDGTTNQYINLYLQSALSNAGGTINLLFGDGGATNNSTIVCAGCGTLLSGAVTGTPTSTPEPATLLLLGSGLVGLFGASRRKLLTR